MSSKRTEVKLLAELIRPYGLTIRPARKHKQILNAEGEVVWHMSSTPSCRYYAVNTLHDLIRQGLVPKGTKLH